MGGDGLGSSSSSNPALTSRDVDAELQLASAFLPGRVASSHIQTVARHLLKLVSSIAAKCSLMADAAAGLTQELGETRFHYWSYFLLFRVWAAQHGANTCCHMFILENSHETLLVVFGYNLRTLLMDGFFAIANSM